MADIIDVLNGVVTALSAGIYPSGTTQPSATGTPTKIYAGWPTESQLDADLIANTAHVTVYPLPAERVESITNLDAVTKSMSAAGTTLTISANQVTVGGTPAVGDVAVIHKNYIGYAYAIVASDTAATIATALAALIGGVAAGSVITAPAGTFALAAKVSVPAVVTAPMRRLSRNMQVTVWASTPAIRDATGKKIDQVLFSASPLSLADGSACGMIYMSSPRTDMMQKAKLYRRDLILQASYVASIDSNSQTVADIVIAESSLPTPVIDFNISQGV